MKEMWKMGRENGIRVEGRDRNIGRDEGEEDGVEKEEKRREDLGR